MPCSFKCSTSLVSLNTTEIIALASLIEKGTKFIKYVKEYVVIWFQKDCNLNTELL